ncbi:MAG: DUF4147 domain-containing protein [Gammaproteobacteria bacterium]|nr:DUF4147 domain-containing protein [Gammaproteobacteria bacterium]
MSAHLNLLAIVAAGLKSVDGEVCVGHALNQANTGQGSVGIVAIGKASVAMAEGAWAYFGSRIVSGLVIAKEQMNDVVLPSVIQCHIGGHPIPDQRSLDAGELLIRYLEKSPSDIELVFLISGGASALVEVLADDVSLDQLQSLNRWLLTSSLDITHVNVLRQCVSRIKAGRLAKVIRASQVSSLLMSDVPANDMAIIGSGLLTASSPSVSFDGLPDEIRQYCSNQPPRPALNDKKITSIRQKIVADINVALSTMAATAEALSYVVHRHDKVMNGDVNDWVDYIVSYLDSAPKGLHCWGGETTIELPKLSGQIGCGGRNTHMALELAVRLAGVEDVIVVCVATDGDDGCSGYAGAIINGKTLSDKGITIDLARHALNAADSATLLKQTSALLTYPKGRSNVADIFLLLKS